MNQIPEAKTTAILMDGPTVLMDGPIKSYDCLLKHHVDNLMLC